ncbi:MAG: MSCRAMM family protein, partial [Planctomycetota bacterium]
ESEPVVQSTAAQEDPGAGGDVDARSAERADAASAADVGERQEVEAVPAPAAGPVVLSGRLVDGSARPEVGVLVQYRAQRGPGRVFVVDVGADDAGGVRTDADGRFSIEVDRNRAGELQLPRSEERLFGASEQRSLEVAAISRSTDLGDIPVTGAAVIAGRVVDESGQPVAGAKVQPLLGGSGMKSLFPMLLGRDRSVEAGEDGRFVLAGLEPGEITFGAEAKGYVPATEKVEVRVAERRDDVVVVLARGASIAGTVIDDRGLPVAGAKVGVERMREIAPGLQFSSVDEESQVETDENGYFLVSGVEGPKVSLIARAAGHAQKTLGEIELGDGSVLFRLDRLGRITGSLLDTEGQPIAGSRISLSGRAVEAVTTDAEGRFEIQDVAPGSVSLSAEGKGHVPVEGYTVHVVAGATVGNVTLRAETGAVLVATVVDAKGQPVSGAEVRVTAAEEQGGMIDLGGGGGRIRRARAISIGLDAGEGGSPMRFLDGGSLLRKERTGPDGVARIAGLPTGSVRVSAEGKTDAPSRAVDLQIPRRGTVDTILSLRPAGLVLVRVVDATGQPAESVRFTLRGPENVPDAGQSPHRGRTDPNGEATVAQLLEGSYSVVLELDAKPTALGGNGGFQFVIGDGSGGESLESTRRTVQVIANTTAEVVLQKPLLTRVFGTVTAADGPAAGVRVTLRADSDQPMFGGGSGNSATTSADGSFEIVDVAAGTYRLEWGRGSQMVKHRDEIVVPAGVAEMRRDLDMPVGILEVTAVDQDGAPVSGAAVRLSRMSGGGETVQRTRVAFGLALGGPASDSGGMTSFTFGDGSTKVETDAQGRARIEDVPPGEYRMTIESQAHAEKRVEPVVAVNGGTTDAGVVTLEAAGVIEGTVTGLPAGGGGLPSNLALVELRLAGDENDRRPPTMAQDGKFRIDGLAPGDYEVRARPIGPGAGGDAAGPWQPVRVEAGRPTNVSIPASGR